MSLRLAASSRDEAQAKAASSKAKVAGLADEVRALKASAEEQGRRETGRIARAALDSRLLGGTHPARVPAAAARWTYIGSSFNP